MNKSSKLLKFFRMSMFALVPLLILILLLEVGARFVYYQRHANGSLAIIKAYYVVQNRILLARSEKLIQNLPENFSEWLYSVEGSDLLNSYKAEYERDFVKLLHDVESVNSKFAILYIPTGDFENEFTISDSREFFTYLSDKYSVELIDLSDTLLSHPSDIPYLYPENGHLSRFGNKLVAEALGDYIKKYSDYRSNFVFSHRPDILGDLEVGVSGVWDESSNMPYHVTTNSQGLRMASDLVFPSEKQRILFLGDSFTFGPYLNDHDTYPALLAKADDTKDFINAGISGYTVTDEASLFSERAKYTEPDITILQVLDNDIGGLFFWTRSRFNRNNQFFEPSELEKEFLSI